MSANERTTALRMTSGPSDGPGQRARKIELLRAGWGAALLFAPRYVMSNVHHVRVDRKSIVIARILGGRQLAQAILSGSRPSPEVLAMGVWADAAHAITALGLAVLDRSRACAGVTDTAVASFWAGAGYRDLTSAGSTSPSHQRCRDRLARTVLGIVPGGGPLLRRVGADRQRLDNTVTGRVG